MRLAVIGDVHLAFDESDVEQLDEASYDAILFVGDLAGYSHRGGLEVARSIGRLRTPAVVIPGNHDAANLTQMVAEVVQSDAIVELFKSGQGERVQRMRTLMAPAQLVGYSRHPLTPRRGGEVRPKVDLIACRPHSVGGPHLGFRPYLEEAFGISTFEASAARLKALVEESDAEALLFLAHNGPTGLGDRREDIWGCDFRKEEGDFGDPDLREAVEHAQAIGKRVLAVVAGHMHHHLRGGGRRVWQLRRDGVLYVNAARVPRIFQDDLGRPLRHHVSLTLVEGAEGVEAVAEERLLPDPPP